jgi:Putative Ig domain
MAVVVFGLGNASCNSSSKDVAPSGLTYSAEIAVYTVGTAIAPNTPTSSGGNTASYSVAPTLPAGLDLNSSTGIISGTPSAAAVTTNYAVTATNSGGSAKVTLTITVNDTAPSNLTYAANPAVYTLKTPIQPNKPSNSGGKVVTYTGLCRRA